MGGNERMGVLKGILRPVSDGRFLLQEYKGSFSGKPIEGFVMTGYEMQPAPDNISVTGTYDAFQEEWQQWSEGQNKAGRGVNAGHHGL